MIKTYRFRVYPSRPQRKRLLSDLRICRLLYNYLLELNVELYRKSEGRVSIVGKFQGLLKYIRVFEPTLITVHNSVLQDVCNKLDSAFKHFFRRVKLGEKPGFPRFKTHERYDSLGCSYMGFKLRDNGRMRFSKVGDVKVKFHRNLPKDVRVLRATFKRTPTDKWYVSLTCELPETEKLPKKTGRMIALDLGLSSYATDHEGNKTENPRYLREKLEELKELQSKTDKKKSNKVKRRFTRLHEKVKNQRQDFLHKLSRRLVNNYDVVIVEDLDKRQMLENNNEKLTGRQNRGLHRSITDASWGYLIAMLSYKAAEAGRRVVKVDPRNTTKRCSCCGELVPKELSMRVHDCPNCGLVLDRDHNAALNILRLGTESLRASQEAS